MPETIKAAQNGLNERVMELSNSILQQYDETINEFRKKAIETTDPDTKFVYEYGLRLFTFQKQNMIDKLPP